MPRAALYTRISRDREGTEVGVQRQGADCRALCERHGWEVAEVYTDDDVSASSSRRRPSYQRMLADLRAGRVDAIVAYSSSRLYRKVRDLDELVTLVEEHGTAVATVVSGNIDLTTADGRMLARMLAVVDQGEAERIGERSRRAKAALKEEGKWLGGGSPAYGYERVPDQRGRVTHRVRHDEAAVLQEAARRLIVGESLNAVTRDLNARGVRTRRGGRWQPSRLRATLTSPFHAGLHADGKPGEWEAIIGSDERALLLAKFPLFTEGAGKGHGAHPARRYALSGMLYCSECGRKLLGSGGAYRCMPRNGGCGKVRISSQLLDPFIQEQAMQRVEAQEEDGEAPRTGGDPEPLIAEVRQLHERREEAREAFASGELNIRDWRDLSQTLDRRVAEVEARIRETAPVREVSFQKLLEGPDALEWNDFLTGLVDRVIVSPALRKGRASGKDTPLRVAVTWR